MQFDHSRPVQPNPKKKIWINHFKNNNNNLEKKKKIPEEEKKCYPLSFQTLGGRDLTRALQSTLFQMSGGVPWALRRTDEQKSLCLIKDYHHHDHHHYHCRPWSSWSKRKWSNQSQTCLTIVCTGTQFFVMEKCFWTIQSKTMQTLVWLNDGKFLPNYLLLLTDLV